MTPFLPFFLTFILAADSQVGGRTSPDGAEQIQIDLPGKEQLKNVGGRDGAGLCVFTSLEHSGRWQNVEQLTGFQSKMKKEEGGGWPEKVDKMVSKYAPGITYLQYQGNDPTLLKLALKTGRMPAVTYGYSPRYGGSGRIAHMVNLVHFSDKWTAVLDNNFPGENNYEWMAPVEFVRRWKLGGGGWAVFLLAPPPPPAPAPASQKFFQAPHEPAEPAEAPAAPLFGVETDKMSLTTGCFLNGKKITPSYAQRVLEGGELTDDTHKLHVTIISQDTAAATKVKSDLEKSAWAPVLLIQSYPPTHWAVSDVGFNTEGSPRIIVQGPPGADGYAPVLHSQGDYSDGIDGLISALRRKAPNYDPQKDKDGRKGPDITNTLTIVRAVVMAALIAFFAGWFGRTLVPAALAGLKGVHAKVFPPKPTLEESILAAMKKLKEQEAANGNRTDANKPS